MNNRNKKSALEVAALLVIIQMTWNWPHVEAVNSTSQIL